MNSLRKRVFTVLFIVLCCGFIINIYTKSKSIYNTSAVLHNKYEQVLEEKKGFYDKLWKTYLQKEKISSVNKETFTQVSKIVMDGRKDGQNISWKWVTENQRIPFEEFTMFYKELSVFIEQQRKEYYALEMKAQSIAYQNNTLLDTIPNNIYNKFINCKHIKYEYSVLSDSTNTVFKNKTENLK